MGANQSADLLVGNEFEQTSFNVKYDTHFVRDINNDLYGESQLIQYQESISHPYLILKQRLIVSKQEYEEYIKEPQKRKLHRSPYLIPLLSLYQVKQQDYCSKYYKVYMLYQYCQKNLFDYMIEMNEKQQSFTQIDILQMIENVLQGLIYLKQQGIQHDMIKSSTIAVSIQNSFQNYSMIDDHQNITSKKLNSTINDNNYQSVSNQEIKYMIADSKFMHNGKDSYTQALFGDAQDFYLSPQLFTQLKHRYMTAFSGDNQNANEQHSIETSTIFSLGMVSVEMATLKSVRKIYDFDYFCLNKGRLMNKLDLISQLYSPQLAFIISKMLLFNEKERPTFQEMLNIIHSFQQDPSQFLDINFTPEMILENYNLSNTEVDIQNHPSQINGFDEDDADIIKRAQKQNLQETKNLYTFKEPTSQREAQILVTDPENNLIIINNSASKNNQIKNRSKSPNTQRKEFSTPNKVHNDQLTPGKSSSHHMRGLSTALHNPDSQSSQKINLSSSEIFQKNSSDQQNPHQSILQNNQNKQQIQNFQQNGSESQIRFHRDEVNNTPQSITYLPNSVKSGGKLSSQILPSSKPSNQSSRVPSQKLIHYTQPDFKLEKEYECVSSQIQQHQVNNSSYNKMRPNDPIDRKKYSNSYSQSLLQNSINNTIKLQSNQFINQSSKQENFNPTDQYEFLQSNSNQISQQYHHAHKKNQSEVMQESNKITFSKQFPINQPLNKNNQSDMNQKMRAVTPDFSLTKINIDDLNQSIKINQTNVPNSIISPHSNFQKRPQQNYHLQPQLSNKSGRSESLIASQQNLYSPIGDSQNHNKISLKFSPKNTNLNNNLFQESPNFFKSSDQVKRSCPTQQSMNASNPSLQGISQIGQVNQSIKQSIQNGQIRQNNYTPQDNDCNNFINQYSNHLNPSQNNSLQRNDDSISVQVPNEIDMSNHEYPAQRIYKSDTKPILESKKRQPMSHEQSSCQKKQQSSQQTGQNNLSNSFLNSCQQKNEYPIQQSYNQLNQPQESQNLGDSYYPSYTQSIGIHNYSRQSQQQLQNLNQYPSQSQKQFCQNINQNNPCYIPSASSIAIAHNLNGSNKFEQSISVKEQLFTQPPHQNIYDLIQQKQLNNHNLNQSKSQIDIKSIIKDKSSENILDNSLINQNLTINGPPTPRNQIRGNRNMYHLYEQSPNKDDLKYKLEKVSIPEEEYQKDIQQTITELEQKIRDFDSRIYKSKLGNSQILSQQLHDKGQEDKESSFKKFLNTITCKSNANVKTEGDNRPIPQQRTPLKNLFTDDRVSPERFPIGENANQNINNTSYSRSQLQNYSRQNNFTDNRNQNNHSSKSPVQNPRDMRTFFQETAPFTENQY